MKTKPSLSFRPGLLSEELSHFVLWCFSNKCYLGQSAPKLSLQFPVFFDELTGREIHEKLANDWSNVKIRFVSVSWAPATDLGN